MNTELLNKILQYPHLFGHLLGYDKLLPIHSQWIISAFAKNKRKYVLQACRNTYKTTAIIPVGVIWYLLFNPNATVLILRKELTGATSNVESVIKHYNSDIMFDIYRELLDINDFHLTKETKISVTLSTKTQITKEGSIEALGIGGAITGRHYDVIVADDIITYKDRASRAEREMTKNFVRELSNILKTDGLMIMTGTPWHKEDAFSILPEPEKYPIGSEGLPVWTEEHIEELKQSTTASLFAINYQLKHISDENKIFSELQFRPWEENMRGVRAGLDPAYYGKNTTALVLFGINEANEYVLKGWVWRKDVTECYTMIVSILNNHKCGSIWIEKNADKGLSAKDINALYPLVNTFTESTNKHMKIISFLKPNFRNIFFADDCQEGFVNQVIDYEEGLEPDDAPDILASLIRETGIFNKSVLPGKNIGVTVYENAFKF